MATKRPLYCEIASLLQARRNCKYATNTEWYEKHGDRLEKLLYNHMPSGSGIDNGTKLEEDECKPGKLVFYFSYHHMDENGMYDGWTDHKLVVKPTFDGIDLYITGRDRNQIKDYLYEVYGSALKEEVEIQ